MSVAPSAAVRWWNSLTNMGQVTYRGLYHKHHGCMASEPDVADWAYNEEKEASMQKLHPAPKFMGTVSPAKPPGKHIRVVFSDGRDLNIFGVTEELLGGSVLRFTDHAGSVFVVFPEKVNYMENKYV